MIRTSMRLQSSGRHEVVEGGRECQSGAQGDLRRERLAMLTQPQKPGLLHALLHPFCCCCRYCWRAGIGACGLAVAAVSHTPPPSQSIMDPSFAVVSPPVDDCHAHPRSHCLPQPTTNSPGAPSPTWRAGQKKQKQGREGMRLRCWLV